MYGGEARLAPLRTLFPYVRDKYALASAAELAWFKGHASRLAALDYHVLLQADVMVSAAAGNMHNVLVRLSSTQFPLPRFYLFPVPSSV